MELRIGLQGLYERYPDLVLGGDPTQNDSTLLHGAKELLVHLGPAKATTA